MMTLCCKVLQKLTGKTLVTAESLTGGGIGAAITAVPGSSAIYKGGIISYTNEVKHNILGVKSETLSEFGAVSAQTAAEMAAGARKCLNADAAVSVTGLAGPGGDEFGNPVGTVFIGYCDKSKTVTKAFHFAGDRDAVRTQTIQAALNMILQNQ
jgi:nicotinamide-nucleotide amidase